MAAQNTHLRASMAFERSQLLSDMRISQYSSDKVPAEPKDDGPGRTVASRLAEHSSASCVSVVDQYSCPAFDKHSTANIERFVAVSAGRDLLNNSQE
jgi:hypothetical protein